MSQCTPSTTIKKEKQIPASDALKGPGGGDFTQIASAGLWAPAFLYSKLFLVCVHRQHKPKASAKNA
jgi:hypothetical protein